MRVSKLFICLLILSEYVVGQDSSWKKNEFNEVLTFSLPVKSGFAKSSYVTAYGGEINSNFYGIQYYDTIFQPIKNEKQFQASLTGFLSGKASSPTLNKYDASVFDSSLNGKPGLMAMFTTKDSSEYYQRIYYYVTIANDQFYEFYVYNKSQNGNDEDIKYFFKSIIFNSDKLRERTFKLTPIQLSKKGD